MLTALIIDDEPKARRILEELLKEYCPNDIIVVASAEDVPSGVKAIAQFQPDIVFLDIEMPNYTGFQLFDFIADINFETIFTTAYQEYAIQAFKVSAIDYLLKPIQIDGLIASVEKVKKEKAEKNPQYNNQSANKIAALQSNLNNKNQKIALPVSEGLLFVDINDIMYLSAEGAYTEIFIKEKKEKLLVSKNIKVFEELFIQPCFFRAHRSYIINLNCVSQYIKQDGGYIVMENGAQVSLSKDKKEEFLKVYGV